MDCGSQAYLDDLSPPREEVPALPIISKLSTLRNPPPVHTTSRQYYGVPARRAVTLLTGMTISLPFLEVLGLCWR